MSVRGPLTHIQVLISLIFMILKNIFLMNHGCSPSSMVGVRNMCTKTWGSKLTLYQPCFQTRDWTWGWFLKSETIILLFWMETTKICWKSRVVLAPTSHFHTLDLDLMYTLVQRFSINRIAQFWDGFGLGP